MKATTITNTSVIMLTLAVFCFWFSLVNHILIQSHSHFVSSTVKLLLPDGFPATPQLTCTQRPPPMKTSKECNRNRRRLLCMFRCVFNSIPDITHLYTFTTEWFLCCQLCASNFTIKNKFQKNMIIEKTLSLDSISLLCLFLVSVFVGLWTWLLYCN